MPVQHGNGHISFWNHLLMLLCVPQQEDHSMAQPHVARKNCSVTLAYIGFWKFLGMEVLGRRNLVNDCKKGHNLFLWGFSNSSSSILLVPCNTLLVFFWFMWFYSSSGYQGTDDTWHRMSKPKLSLEEDIMSGHNHWETCSKVFYSNYSMY